MARNRSRSGGFSRREGVREERKVSAIKCLMTFSFKDIDFTQPKNNVQSFETWQNTGHILPFLRKLHELSKLTRDEAEKQQIIKVYGDIPSLSKFVHPKHVEQNVSWGVIKNIGGQKGTVPGYVFENTFYVVFLDKDHEFWPTSKKHT